MNNWIVKSEIKSLKFGANENSECKSESFVQNTILKKWALHQACFTWHSWDVKRLRLHTIKQTLFPLIVKNLLMLAHSNSLQYFDHFYR